MRINVIIDDTFRVPTYRETFVPCQIFSVFIIIIIIITLLLFIMY